MLRKIALGKEEVMSDKKVRFRHELKFLISYAEKDVIESRLKTFATIDSHAIDGQYFIRSLYFDDMWHNAYEEKMAGTASRKKYRVRIYNYSDDFISLECKHKQGNYIYKTSARLSREEFEKIIKGDYSFLLKRDDELCREFYVECITNGMRPEVIVDYDRVPWIYDHGTVRITFDMKVRSAFNDWNIFSKNIPAFDAMESDYLIMEVKYTEFFPEIFRSILPPEQSIYTAASKFVMCDDVKRDIYGIN